MGKWANWLKAGNVVCVVVKSEFGSKEPFDSFLTYLLGI